MAERLIANSVLSVSSYMEINDEVSWCWDWIGARAGNGRYGKVSLRFKKGPRKGKIRHVLAHRLSLVTFKRRYLNTRTVVKHLCNNPLCINPAHLEGGTILTNNRQTVRDGRHRNMYSPPKPLVQSPSYPPAYEPMEEPEYDYA